MDCFCMYLMINNLRRNKFKFVVADTHLYKQFGNSVTVPVIRAIAEKIKAYLEKENTKTKKSEEVFEQLAFTWR